MRCLAVLLLVFQSEILFSQEGGMGSYLSRTTTMPVRAETLREDDSEPGDIQWSEGLIVTEDSDSLYGFVKYDMVNLPGIIGFKTKKAPGQQTFNLRRVYSFNFLELDKQYIRYFKVLPSAKKKPQVLEKIVAGTIEYWKKRKIYHYGSRSSGTVTIPKIEYDYYFSVQNELEKVNNFKKQLIELVSPFDLDPMAIAKEKELKLSSPVARAMLVYHVNDAIKQR
ncbi:MAG: hypothetical protein AAF519_11065 [Bacteroidota bacterium]